MTLPLHPGTWVLDDTHSTVEFTARHLGISKVRGRFDRFDATVTIGDDLGSCALRAEVDLASVDTRNADRDAHLRGDDFFDVDNHPKMTFESTRIVATDHGYDVTGDLTIRGRTTELTLAVEFHGSEVFPGDGSVHAGFSATGTVSRSAHGVDFNVPMASSGFVISDRIGIELDIQLLPAPATLPA
jgi:polyisoprenoid-binding protein YceI